LEKKKKFLKKEKKRKEIKRKRRLSTLCSVPEQTSINWKNEQT